MVMQTWEPLRRKVQDNCLRLYLLDPTIKIQAQSNDFAITSNISYIAVKRTAPRCIRNVKYNKRDKYKDTERHVIGLFWKLMGNMGVIYDYGG